MTDDLQQRAGQDRERIDVSQEHEVRHWAERFGVTHEQLKEAVGAVGTRASDVELHLKGSRSTSNSERSAG